MIKTPVLALLESHLVLAKTKYKNSSSVRLRYWRNKVETHPVKANVFAVRLILCTISVLDSESIYWVGKAWELVEPLTV